MNLVSNVSKRCESNVLRSFHRCRIVKRPVEPSAGAGEDRARFLGVAAHRNDILQIAPRELIHRLRAVAGYINTNLAHDGDRFQANSTGLDASGKNIETISTRMAQPPFSHLTSSG